MATLIGLLAEVTDERDSALLYPYAKSIERAGGVPLLLPYVEDAEAVSAFVRLCDGFFFTGGADISPSRYGEDTKPTCGAVQLFRDDLEFRVLDEVLRTSKPILAVCRGAQVVNAALGGTLYQDLPTECPSELLHRQVEERFTPSHEVAILEGTPLYDLVGAARMQANSFHHQAVKALGEGLCVMAEADDGVIEAFYLEGERYLRAYQWHPERLAHTNGDNHRIFEDFVSACRAGK